MYSLTTENDQNIN